MLCSVHYYNKVQSGVNSMRLTYLRQSLLIVPWSWCSSDRVLSDSVRSYYSAKTFWMQWKFYCSVFFFKKYRFKAFIFQGRPLGAYYERYFNLYRLSHRHQRALYVLTCFGSLYGFSSPECRLSWRWLLFQTAPRSNPKMPLSWPSVSVSLLLLQMH